MAGAALKRLMAEYRQLTLNPPEGIIADITHRMQENSNDKRIKNIESKKWIIGFTTPSARRFNKTSGPINEENFFEWEALIMGPEGTPFEDGVFTAKIVFPSDYPLSPPKMKFITEMFHPNVYPDGRVCISILHAPGDDPMGYETSAERWSPVQSVEKILLSVVSMLAEPNDESGANVDASKMWRDNREQFNKIARNLVRKSLNL